MKPSIHRQSIINLYKQRLSAREIHRRLGVRLNVIYKTIRRYTELGTDEDRSGRGRKRSVVTTPNIRKVREKFRRSAERSVRKMAKEMNLSEPSLRRIVKDHLKLKPYKKNKSPSFIDATRIKRKERCKKMVALFRDQRHRDVLFTDEKVFIIEQSLNKQNNRVYATSKPKNFVGKSAHPLSVMVFACITADDKTPLTFVPQGVKINRQIYLDILKNSMLPWA